MKRTKTTIPTLSRQLRPEYAALWARPIPGAPSFACSPEELRAKFDADPAYEARYRAWITHDVPHEETDITPPHTETDEDE